MMKGNKIIAAAIALLMSGALLAGSLADAGSFSGDSDWGSSDWGSSDWGSSSDWDSGSDWSSSDWDTSSSNDSGWSDFGAGYAAGSIAGSDSSYNDSEGKTEDEGFGGGLITIVIIAVVAIIIFNYFRKKQSGGNGAEVYQAVEEDPGLPLTTLKQKDPDFNEQALVEKIGNQYVQMQQAWQNKDWEPMRAIMTDTLYNQMDHQLEALKEKGLTNKVERIAVLNARIRRYAVEGDNDVLTVRLNTRICDYTVEDKTGNVVQGDPKRELFMTYDWKLIRQKDRKTQNQGAMTEVNCPNCGAPLSINQTGKCPYCGSVVTLSDHDWALSEIKGIAQRTAGK